MSRVGLGAYLCVYLRMVIFFRSAASQFKFSHLGPDVIHMAEIPNPFTQEITVAVDCQIHSSVIPTLRAVTLVLQLSRIHFLILNNQSLRVFFAHLFKRNNWNNVCPYHYSGNCQYSLSFAVLQERLVRLQGQEGSKWAHLGFLKAQVCFLQQTMVNHSLQTESPTGNSFACQMIPQWTR